MTQDFNAGETTRRYNIPISHLDYSYIEKCTDAKELEKILKILRSGDEGCYPELEDATVRKLEKINPKSLVLRQDGHVKRFQDLDKHHRDFLLQDLELWTQGMLEQEHRATANNVGHDNKTIYDTTSPDSYALPDIRTASVITKNCEHDESMANSTRETCPRKAVIPRSYRDWDKFDVETELGKVDEQPEEKKKSGHISFNITDIASNVNTGGMLCEEKMVKAVQEKNKGNEAFHSKDYEEAVLYYSRSISIQPLEATVNNRALAYLRLSKWDDVVLDSSSVLNLNSQNVKALIRRATALKMKGQTSDALRDVKQVLLLEPNNKAAKDLLRDVASLVQESSVNTSHSNSKGYQMVIEEVDGSEEPQDHSPDMCGHEQEVAVGRCSEEVNGTCDYTPATTATPNNIPLDHSEDSSYQEGIAVSKISSDRSSMTPTNLEECSAIDTSDVRLDNMASMRTSTFSQNGRSASTGVIADDVCNIDSGASDQHVSDTDPDMNMDIVSGKNSEVSINHSSDRGTGVNTCQVSNIDVEESVQHGSASSVGKIIGMISKTDGDVYNECGSGVSAEVEKITLGNNACEEDAKSMHSRPVLIHRDLTKDQEEFKQKAGHLFSTGQYHEAVSLYTTLIDQLESAEQRVNLALSYSNRAACHLKTGDCRSAISDCDESLTLVPHAIKPLLRKATAFESQERYRQAYVDYKHALSVDSRLAVAVQGASRCQKYLQIADGVHWRCRLPKMVHVRHWEIPTVVLEKCDNQGEGMLSCSHKATYDTSTRLQGADLNSEVSAASHATGAVTMSETRDVEEVFQATKMLGNEHVKQGRYQAAVECYSQCASLNPDRAAVFTNRALCFLKLSKVSEAEDDCNKALALDTGNVKALYRRALCKKERSDFNGALEDLYHLLRLDERNVSALREVDIVKNLLQQCQNDVEIGTPQQLVDSYAWCERAEGERSRTRINIEVEEDSDQELLPDTGRTAGSQKCLRETNLLGLPSAPITVSTVPDNLTPYNFMQLWTSLKQTTDIQQCAQLLRQIPPTDLPTLIGKKLEADMLQTIVRCAAHYTVKGEIERACSTLENVSLVPRFHTIAMFLSSKDKQDVCTVLNSVNSLGPHQPARIEGVRKAYRID